MLDKSNTLFVPVDLKGDFTRMVDRLAKSPSAIQLSLTPAKIHLIHMAMGISGEAIELMGNTDQQNLIEECGDLEFYLCGASKDMGFYKKLEDYTELFYQLVPKNRYTVEQAVVHFCGEFTDLIKKYTIYNKPLDAELNDKLNEAYWLIYRALEDLYKVRGIPRPQVLEANIQKLSKGKDARYKEGYSDAAAQARADKAGE